VNELYDRIGTSYLATRRPDPRLACVIWGALGDAETVLNVGAGAGGYEPPDRAVTALEPSEVMIAQRPPAAPPVTRGHAEQLPFPADSFDATMAVFSDHHWRDRERGLRELARVARRRVVIFNMDPSRAGLLWMTAEYLEEFLLLIEGRYRDAGVWQRELERTWGNVTLVTVPIPHDCSDGFYGAYWRRPEAYLDPTVRAGISVFAKLPADAVERAVEQLRADLDSGAWHERHRDLLELDALDLGYRVAIAELAPGQGH
jgi:SAM-dependent methyltransferase